MYKDVWKKAAALFLCACMAGTSVDLTAFTVHAQEQTATEEKVEAEKTEQPEITDETTEDAQKSEVQTEAVNQEEEQSVSTYIAPLVEEQEVPVLGAPDGVTELTDANTAIVLSASTYTYDGTEKKFKEVKFVPTANTLKLVEGKDYEIKYFNNITGPEAYVYINAIGNYTNKAEQTFPGSKQTYAVKSDAFTIAGVTVASRDVTLKDTEYAGGVAATPNLTIKVGEKTLVEGTDYEFVNLSNNTDVTPANKVLTANLKLKNGYAFNTSAWPTTGALAYDATTNTVKVTWKIVKKDLANTTVEISETNGKLTATVLNGKVIVPATEYDVKDNGDGTATVTAKADSKSYKGSQKVSVKKSENVGAPVISNVNVSGNTATVILSGETDGASGYDYVISTSKDPANKDARLDVVKNQVQTTANFKYVPQGTYYAYCHAWTRDENGKKVFGGWSNSYAFSVTAITPDTPEILSVKTKGSTITVTYKESANSTGYDVVLGKGSKKEHGETRPYQYGKYKKLNVKPGVCKAVFKNVPAGTYYAGVHSWNRTASENDNKVFSKWSNLETAKVK